MNKTVILIGLAILIIVSAVVVVRTNSSLAPSSNETTNTLPSIDETANSQMFITPGPFNVTAESVSYYQSANGYYAAPAQTGQYPGVVMIHEWWGLNDNIKDMARLLGSKGYHVLAVDLYNGKVATDATQARQLTSSLDKTQAIANMKSAIS